MKRIIIYFIFLFLCFFQVACEKEMEIYHATGEDCINFYYSNSLAYESDTSITYTFIYLPETQMTDTIWFDLETSGFVTDYNRTIALEQIDMENNAAVPGKHYVAFNDPILKNIYVVPAHSTRARIPVILKKDDPELNKQEVILRVRIQKNEYFNTGFPGYQERCIRFSNMLTKPKNWNFYAEYYFAGTYGPVKYRFMIHAAAEKKGITLNEDFFYSLVGDPYAVDLGLTEYWKNFFKTALVEENAKRAAQGEGPLREAPAPGESEGILVSFDL